MQFWGKKMKQMLVKSGIHKQKTRVKISSLHLKYQGSSPGAKELVQGRGQPRAEWSPCSRLGLIYPRAMCCCLNPEEQAVSSSKVVILRRRYGSLQGCPQFFFPAALILLALVKAGSLPECQNYFATYGGKAQSYKLHTVNTEMLLVI